jgi:hypothetical protein
MDISFKDDVPIILLLGNAFMLLLFNPIRFQEVLGSPSARDLEFISNLKEFKTLQC